MEELLQNKDKLLNTNQTVHKCFKVFRVGKISIDSVTFIGQFYVAGTVLGAGD